MPGVEQEINMDLVQRAVEDITPKDTVSYTNAHRDTHTHTYTDTYNTRTHTGGYSRLLVFV